MIPDEKKLNEFLGKVVADAGAAMSSALVVLGDRLGLYKALAKAPCSAKELAEKTQTVERYVQEWLDAQTSGGYVVYDPKSQRYALPPEQAAALADDDHPASVPGMFQVAAACWAAIDQMSARFKSGEGFAWGEHHHCLFEGTERFFRAGYTGNLVSSWLPALDGATARLEKGAKVADVGCGFGASTIIMAKAYPRSRFFGYDTHEPSIIAARERAKAAGVADRVTFDVAGATDFPGRDYDLIAHFDCLHDMENPTGAARRAKDALASDGYWMIVEPFASDKREENHNPVGRVFYSASTMICVPHSLSRRGPALGAQAGEGRLGRIVKEGGFTRFRRATATPFNLILEARP
ncbi:MAG: methyltransferase domain-containing protein [Deltaproteobacteria bacterium]|nr:methyltransferase domain-containing protein [Deltaproteobacteria bacterium]